MSKSKIGVVANPREPLHFASFPKPNLEAFENPLRTQMAIHYLETSGALERLERYDAPKASVEDALLVHSPYLVDTVSLMSEIGSGQLGESAYASPELLRSALLAVGGAKRALQAVITGEVQHSFAIVRPPGHHASFSNPMGLCYFNNVAIAATIALGDNNVNRVSIVDIDDHHGNGTSEIFYARRDVQYISVHEYDYENFGVGHFNEIGWGEGIGTNVNIPLVEATPDSSYEEACRRVITPALKQFKPDLIMVSAGFDAHFSDPVGNMNVDSKTFWKYGRELASLSASLGCRGTVWVLEGGYNPLAIGPCIHACLEGLGGQECPKLYDQIAREENELIVESNREVFDQVLGALEPHW